MDDASSRFWETLIVEWVAVALLAFILQGVWFGATAFLVERQPAWEGPLASLSGNLGKFWLAAIVAALAWSVKRARSDRERPLAR